MQADWMLDILDVASDDEENNIDRHTAPAAAAQSDVRPAVAATAAATGGDQGGGGTLDVSIEPPLATENSGGDGGGGSGPAAGSSLLVGGEKLAAIFAQSAEHRALSGSMATQSHNSTVALLGSDDGGGGGGGGGGTAGAAKVSARQSSWCRQTLTLTRRTALVTLRDPSIIFIRTGAALAVGGLVGLIFYNQPRDDSSAGNRINVILFVMCCFSLFCLPAISRYFEERLTFVRERSAGRYCTSAYYVASMLVELPLLALIVAGYGTLAYKLVGLNPAPGRFGLFLCIIFLVINVGFSWSQLLAACSSSVSVAIAGFMVVLVYSLLLGGFIVSVSDLGETARWVVQTSYFWQGYEALMVNEFSGDPQGACVRVHSVLSGFSRSLLRSLLSACC
jgi:hypothetical protein